MNTGPGFYEYVSAVQVLENTVGKGEFSSFPTLFSVHVKNFLSFIYILGSKKKCAFCFSLIFHVRVFGTKIKTRTCTL